MNISKELGVSKVLAKVLTNRDIDDLERAEYFLKTDINKLYSPKLMRNLIKAGDILKKKIDNKKPIRIVGDYDVDGVMSIYVVYTILKDLGRSEEHTSELQSRFDLVCRLLLEKKNDKVQ